MLPIISRSSFGLVQNGLLTSRKYTMRCLISLCWLLISFELPAADLLYEGADIEAVKASILETLAERNFIVDQESNNRLILSTEISGFTGMSITAFSNLFSTSNNESNVKPRSELSFMFLKKPEGVKVIATKAILHSLDNGNVRREGIGDGDLPQFLAEIKQKLSGSSIAPASPTSVTPTPPTSSATLAAASNKTTSSIDMLPSFLKMTPSLTQYADSALWIKSVEPSQDGKNPGAALIGVACKEKGKLAITVGTEIVIKKTFSLYPPMTDVRYFFDADESHWNWERFGTSEAGPMTGLDNFLDKLIGAKTLRIAFEREGQVERKSFTFMLDEQGMHESLAKLQGVCK